jgi:hypothetical protein
MILFGIISINEILMSFMVDALGKEKNLNVSDLILRNRLIRV